MKRKETRGFVTRKVTRLETDKSWLEMRVRNIDREISDLLKEIESLNRYRIRCSKRINYIKENIEKLEPRLKCEEVKEPTFPGNFPMPTLSDEELENMF